MKPVFNRSPFSYIPGYSQNAVVKLIVCFMSAYVCYYLVDVVMMMLQYPRDAFDRNYTENLALPALPLLKWKLWTLLTYGWFHIHFMNMLSNMIWLYCFGSLVQMLVGYKQVFPLFLYSLVAGGVLYLVSQLIPGAIFEAHIPDPILGPMAGLTGLAAAAITISPQYRFFLTERFSVPIVAVVGIFALLMVINTGFHVPLLFMLIGGGLTGFLYIRLLRSGYKPGDWMYSMYSRMERVVTPDERASWQKHNKKRNDLLSRLYEPKNGITQKKIDDILDKINLKGYKALTQEEKDVLLHAGKENNN